jgi:hypothetical protein
MYENAQEVILRLNITKLYYIRNVIL